MLCNLCPRTCGVERTQTQGVCGMPELPVVARAALHLWEEPPISGTRGSGTVFFSGCSLGCVYCQNEKISHENYGKRISISRLREIFLALIAQGAHNINLVNPTHFTHAIREALEAPLPVPVVWNSSGYERVETLRTLEGKVSIYLPDFKYPDEAGAERYSAAKEYPDIARAALKEMVRQTGPCCMEDGILQRGTIIRHLILPGRLKQAKEVMDFVAEAFPPQTVLFSLMSQYTPWGKLENTPELGRKLRASEARNAAEYMQNLGLDGFVQSEEASGAGFIPPFDLTGVSYGGHETPVEGKDRS